MPLSPMGIKKTAYYSPLNMKQLKNAGAATWKRGNVWGLWSGANKVSDNREESIHLRVCCRAHAGLPPQAEGCPHVGRGLARDAM